MAEILSYYTPMLQAHIRIEQIKAYAREKPAFTPWMCHCKLAILDAYLTAYQNLLTQVASTLMTVGTAKEWEHGEVQVLLGHCKDVFLYQSYQQLYASEGISKKMIVLFERIQRPIEVALWNLIENHLHEFAALRNGRKYKVFTETVQKLEAYADLALLNLNGLRINCLDLKNTILPDGMRCNARCRPSTTDHEARPCTFHNDIGSHQELRLMLTPEAISTNGWCGGVLGLMEHYHVDPKRVTLTVDCSLMDCDSLPGSFKHYYLPKAQTLFKQVDVVGASCP